LTTLKDFPQFPQRGDEADINRFLTELVVWKMDFEGELLEELTPRIIDAMTELVDDRSDFKKGWKIGYIDCLKRVLDSPLINTKRKAVR